MSVEPTTPPSEPAAPGPSVGNPTTTGLAKTYRPAEHENRITARWDQARVFHADPSRVLNGDARPYCIFIPPPNVTAALHLGHALNNTLQDVLARAHRMMGFETLWMPGTDHAGIATQAVVEKRVLKEEGKRRKDFSREEFIAKIQAFKDEYEATITNQLKEMGCSCDWDRQRFTMDSQCAAAVREAFFQLFKDGLIYRGKRLVNWDPALQTAVADDECYEEEVDSHFYYLKYPIVGSSETITVATTRPETYLGDTAVAINPKDPRAANLLGRHVRLPLLNREIPIVADDYAVLPEAMATTEEEKNDPKAKFSTGFVKITPAHDQNDYALWQRHLGEIPLGAINMMSPDGRVSDTHGLTDAGEAKVLVGKSMAEARKLVVKEFESRGLLESVKPYRHSLKFSDRSKAVIEPYLSDQWYVKVTDPRMAAAANEALVGRQSSKPAKLQSSNPHDSSLTFHPDRYAKTYEQWHDNIRDWCISRQLWWGHRIPVWVSAKEAGDDLAERIWKAVDVDHSAHITQSDDHQLTFVCLATDDQELIDEIERPEFGFVRDPDVLDTWFSSALWPLSTLGWPDPTAHNADANAGLLEAFNPSSVLCTAREIITLWVSRMVMFNRYFLPSGQGTGPVPFKDVFIHAMIQDGEGRKMSKSLGNGVDPRDIIASHGSDAMRFTLVHMTTQTQDVRMPVEHDPATGTNTSPKFDLGRNFCNKLWNASRYALGILGKHAALDASRGAPITASDLTLIDRWMLGRLASTTDQVNSALQSYDFSEYAESMYKLLWWDFCDWYLEAIKPTVDASPSQRAVLAHALEVIVRLLHPVAPFITEVIWEHLRGIQIAPVQGVLLNDSRKGELLCTAGWPRIDAAWRSAEVEQRFEQLRELITVIREVRSQHQLAPKRRIVLHAPHEVAEACAVAPGVAEALSGLDRIEKLGPGQPSPAVSFRVLGTEAFLSNLADAVDAGAERERLTKQITDLEKTEATMDKRLSNEGYVAKAPPKLVEESKAQLAGVRAELAALRAKVRELG